MCAVVRRRVDARLDGIQLNGEVVKQLPEVVSTDVIRRVDAPRLHVLPVLVVKIVVDGEQQPTRPQRVQQRRTASSPAALGNAGYCIDTKSNDPTGNAIWRTSPQIQSISTPASPAASRALLTATSETSIAVTLQPLRASQIASAPSPQPTSRAWPGVRSATSARNRPFGRPLHIAPSGSLYLSSQ